MIRVFKKTTSSRFTYHFHDQMSTNGTFLGSLLKTRVLNIGEKALNLNILHKILVWILPCNPPRNKLCHERYRRPFLEVLGRMSSK